MPAFEVDGRLSAVPDTTAFLILFFLPWKFGMTDTWPALLRGFDVRKIF